MSDHRLQSAMIISLSDPADDDAPSTRMLDLIADVVVQRNVCRIVVCGQPSDACLTADADQPALQEETTGYHQMLQRIQARIERQHLVQRRVLTQMGRIATHSRLAQAVASRPISLCGLFYIPECDAFLVYDDSADRFIPITAARLR